MPESGTSGSVGAAGGKLPAATRLAGLDLVRCNEQQTCHGMDADGQRIHFQELTLTDCVPF